MAFSFPSSVVRGEKTGSVPSFTFSARFSSLLLSGRRDNSAVFLFFFAPTNVWLRNM